MVAVEIGVRAEIKTAPRRKRANSGGGGSKTGRVGQTMIREKMSRPYLFDNSILVASIPLTHQIANALQEISSGRHRHGYSDYEFALWVVPIVTVCGEWLWCGDETNLACGQTILWEGAASLLAIP